MESDQDLVLLLLDFEKAFDRIEWGFLFKALAYSNRSVDSLEAPFDSVEGSRFNMEITQRVLDLFCKALGEKINWNKSPAIWASRKRKEWD